MKTLAKNIKVTLVGAEYVCNIMLGMYMDNRRPAILLLDAETNEPVTVASVNLYEPAFEKLPETFFAAKNWSENEGLWEQIAHLKTENGMPLFFLTNTCFPTGFVVAMVMHLGPTTAKLFNELLEDLDKQAA